MLKPLPIPAARIREIADTLPTPFYLYDEVGIRGAARALFDAFAWAPGFREYFAVKATPSPSIMSVLSDEGCGMDASSLPELLLCERVGIMGERVIFSSNDTPAEEFAHARRLGAIINLDDVGHLPFLARHAGLPELVCFRYNPGAERRGNALIGAPEQAKFGATRAQLFEGYAAARDAGVKRFGLHAMVASNELDAGYFVATARMLFQLAADLSATLGIRFEFVNLGGGIGIPYRPEQQPVDLCAVSTGIRAAYDEIVVPGGLHPLHIAFECGRLLTGPHGLLVARVRHLKRTYKHFAGLDASMADLMRPGMYGAYHHISVLGKEDAPAEHTYDVTGSLCENNDKFAIDRALPELAAGDLVAVHDAGAHGRAMGFSYNGKLRAGEWLLESDGGLKCIRRAETVEDYFATLVWS